MRADRIDRIGRNAARSFLAFALVYFTVRVFVPMIWRLIK